MEMNHEILHTIPVFGGWQREGVGVGVSASRRGTQPAIAAPAAV